MKRISGAFTANVYGHLYNGKKANGYALILSVMVLHLIHGHGLHFVTNTKNILLIRNLVVASLFIRNLLFKPSLVA